MDATRFDRLVRALTTAPTRRGLARGLAAIGLAGTLGLPLDPGHAEAKKKRKKKKCKKCGPCRKCKKGKCQPQPDGSDCGGGQSCLNGTCRCPEGQDACGGACLDSCPTIRLRNPVTCECCRPTGKVERVCDNIHEECCSGLACGSIGEEGTACPGRTLGQPCDFDDQCESGNCNPNLVCA
jgi:hypothetical protein